MSGRDLKNFLVSHRTEDSDKLIKRISEGLSSNKYKEVDYAKLKAEAAQQKIKGHVALIKVKKLQNKLKHGKSQNLIKQHKLVWQKEFLRLNSARKQLQAEIDSLVRQNAVDETSYHIFQDLEDYDTSIGSAFLDFKKATADPLWALRDDLQFWLAENAAQLKAGGLTEEHSKVLQTVNHVKAQQEDILDKLKNEQRALEQELLTGSLIEFSKPVERTVEQGIPVEAFDLECPDLDLKATVLQEFIMLDEKYIEKLDELTNSHATALKSDTGGWSEDDHFLFQVILEQYTYDVRNRWTLIIDRLRRQVLGKTRAEIVAHDEWYTNYKYYHRRRKALQHDWQRDRAELLNKAKAVFAEACITQALAEAKKDHQSKQQEICQALYEKVKEWREYKLEIMKIQVDIEERKREEFLRKEKLEKEKEKERRTEGKKQIEEFHDRKEAKRKESEERELKRLEQIKEILKEQAEYDQKRVVFRQEMQEQIYARKKHLKEEKMKEEEEKEKRLEILREMVRPQVEADPVRVHKDTESWKERLKVEEQPELHLKKPLFQVNTFTTNQITADPRFRVEQKLREAGLLESKYARQAISQVKALHAPRPDMESELFK